MHFDKIFFKHIGSLTLNNIARIQHEERCYR